MVEAVPITNLNFDLLDEIVLRVSSAPLSSNVRSLACACHMFSQVMDRDSIWERLVGDLPLPPGKGAREHFVEVRSALSEDFGLSISAIEAMRRWPNSMSTAVEWDCVEATCTRMERLLESVMAACTTGRLLLLELAQRHSDPVVLLCVILLLKRSSEEGAVLRERLMAAAAENCAWRRELRFRWWTLGGKALYRLRDELHVVECTLHGLVHLEGCDERIDSLLRALRRGCVHEIRRISVAVCDRGNLP